MFAKVDNGVKKSCQNFRRKNRKNANFGLSFSTIFSRIACCARESTSARQNLRQKTAKKEEKIKLSL